MTMNFASRPSGSRGEYTRCFRMISTGKIISTSQGIACVLQAMCPKEIEYANSESSWDEFLAGVPEGQNI